MRLLIRALFVIAGFVLVVIALVNAVPLGVGWHDRAMDANVRAVAVIVACLAGLAAMGWADRALARAEEARRLLRLARGFEGERMVARVKIAWALGLPVVILALAAVPVLVGPGLLQEFDARGALIAVGCALVAILLACVFLPYLWRRGPALVLDGDGVAHVLYGRIPWTQVHGIDLSAVNTGKGGKHYALVLGVADAQPWRANLPAMHRWGGGRRDAPGSLSIPLNLLNVEPDFIHLAATTLRDRVAPPRLRHWAPGLDPAFAAASSRLEANNARIEALMGRMEQAEARTKTGTASERALAQAELERLAAEVDAAMKETSAAVDALVGRRPT